VTVPDTVKEDAVEAKSYLDKSLKYAICAPVADAFGEKTAKLERTINKIIMGARVFRSNQSPPFSAIKATFSNKRISNISRVLRVVSLWVVLSEVSSSQCYVFHVDCAVTVDVCVRVPV
jgi:hypothetical protein